MGLKMMGSKIRIGVLVSGGGSNLQAIIDACEKERIDGEVVFVGSDNPVAGGLSRARKHHIPTWAVDYQGIMAKGMRSPNGPELPAEADIEAVFAKLDPVQQKAPKAKKQLSCRIAFEAAALKMMQETPFDLLVLAGFMRLLSPFFIDAVNQHKSLPRIMNIHPALLPSFPGTDGYGDTLAYGCKVAGCTVHFVDYGEDTGPIIGQRAFAVTPADTIETVRKKGLELEWQLYPECIQLFAQKRLQLIRQKANEHSGRSKRRTVVTITP